jgi:hypothetical protein
VLCAGPMKPKPGTPKAVGSALKLAVAAQVRRTLGAKVAPLCAAKEIGHETRGVSEI